MMKSHERCVVMRTLLAAGLAVALMFFSGFSAFAAPITICGTLQALTRNVPPDSPGSATIDGRSFRLTSALSTNGTNRVEADVLVGQRVCLTGDLTNAPSPQGNVELFQNFVLASCSGASAPTGCVQGLPSTATGPDMSSPGSAIALGGLATAALALLASRRRRRT